MIRDCTVCHTSNPTHWHHKWWAKFPELGRLWWRHHRGTLRHRMNMAKWASQ